MVAFRTVSIAAVLGLFQLTSALPAVEKRGGPLGTVVSPSGGTQVAAAGGKFQLEYTGVVVEGWTQTRSVNAFLVNTNRNYNHTLATDLTAGEPQGSISGWFQVPKDYPGSGTDYQLQIIETQVGPDGVSFNGIEPFVAAAPYLTIN